MHYYVTGIKNYLCYYAQLAALSTTKSDIQGLSLKVVDLNHMLNEVACIRKEICVNHRVRLKSISHNLYLTKVARSSWWW